MGKDSHESAVLSPFPSLALYREMNTNPMEPEAATEHYFMLLDSARRHTAELLGLRPEELHQLGPIQARQLLEELGVPHPFYAVIEASTITP